LRSHRRQNQCMAAVSLHLIIGITGFKVAEVNSSLTSPPLTLHRSSLPVSHSNGLTGQGSGSALLGADRIPVSARINVHPHLILYLGTVC
jgi:hypothetical protein